MYATNKSSQIKDRIKKYTIQQNDLRFNIPFSALERSLSWKTISEYEDSCNSGTQPHKAR